MSENVKNIHNNHPIAEFVMFRCHLFYQKSKDIQLT